MNDKTNINEISTKLMSTNKMSIIQNWPKEVFMTSKKVEEEIYN